MTTTQELIEKLTHESIHIRDGQCDDEFHSALLTEAAQHLRELDKPNCVWTFDEDQGMYDTGCGEAWVFSEGLTLRENKVKFCPFCQGAVKEAT